MLGDRGEQESAPGRFDLGDEIRIVDAGQYPLDPRHPASPWLAHAYRGPKSLDRKAMARSYRQESMPTRSFAEKSPFPTVRGESRDHLSTDGESANPDTNAEFDTEAIPDLHTHRGLSPPNPIRIRAEFDTNRRREHAEIDTSLRRVGYETTQT